MFVEETINFTKSAAVLKSCPPPPPPPPLPPKKKKKKEKKSPAAQAALSRTWLPQAGSLAVWFPHPWQPQNTKTWLIRWASIMQSRHNQFGPTPLRHRAIPATTFDTLARGAVRLDHCGEKLEAGLEVCGSQGFSFFPQEVIYQNVLGRQRSMACFPLANVAGLSRLRPRSAAVFC